MPGTLNEDRLAKLQLLPPPTTQPWTSLAPATPETELSRNGQAAISLPLPLFWYAPDWYLYSTELANPIAAAVGRMGILVSALQSEIAQYPVPSLLHEERSPRIVPYRPERYGLAVEDFDHADVIDVRLTMVQDPAGRFAFPPQQITRWESHLGKSAGMSSGWVAAATFPPDVASMAELNGKVDQLRCLAPESAIFASVQPTDLENDLPGLLEAQLDGVILRVDRFPLDGLSLARLVQKSRSILDSQRPGIPLWVVPGAVTTDDAAKIIALGATGVAIDSWCRELFEIDLSRPASAAQRLGLADASTDDGSDYLSDTVAGHLRERVDRFVGLTSNLVSSSQGSPLGTFDADWSDALGVRNLS